MKRHHLLQLFLFTTIVFLSYTFLQNTYTKVDIDVMKNIEVTKIDKSDSLYQEIVKKAKEYETKPQNATIDKVWKKMPGLSGLQVNIEKSYLNMKKKNKFDEKLIVYNNIRPEISLKDLPASPIFRGHPDKNMVTFLINVSWGEEHIPDMLKTLKKHKVKATFFIDGAWAEKNVELVKMIKEEGHEIGSHGYNHPNMSRLSNEEIRNQLTKTNNILKSIVDEKPMYFAPPAGNYTDSVVKVADELEMETILWTVDTIDWQNPTKQALLNRVLTKVEPGTMILMHPKEVTKDALDELILKIKDKNYKIGTVGKLLDEER
ncbi:polysaccharide deacetylase family protein [Salirhabdus sp. Marseille-P4669]|uniref:polysaccharide deacetylase family protein n=1 Tax=Salirhabdus sp. Marseille-P4669 TaxID=2042310 RepID=UPI000C7C74A7|nr:polysaccharide deacetylase family protein [Salirhabdus sp. Marseille-P4669]